MIGELDFEDTFHAHIDNEDVESQVYFEVNTYIIYAIFLILISIIVMNLLTGLAVSDVVNLQNNASYRVMAKQIDLALDVEFSLPLYFRKKCVVQFINNEIYHEKYESRAQQGLLTKLFNRFIAFWDGNLYMGEIMEELDEKWKKSKQEYKDIVKEDIKLKQTEAMKRVQSIHKKKMMFSQIYKNDLLDSEARLLEGIKQLIERDTYM